MIRRHGCMYRSLPLLFTYNKVPFLTSRNLMLLTLQSKVECEDQEIDKIKYHPLPRASDKKVTKQINSALSEDF